MTKSLLSKIIFFFEDTIWRFPRDKMSLLKRKIIYLIRLLVLSYRYFKEYDIFLRASALTFYTLLSIVPVIAMAFGIAKGFGLEELLEKQIIAQLPGQEEIALRIINFATALLANAKGGIIAGIGLLALFWTVVNLLANIESSFNTIWRVSNSRSFLRKCTDYLSIMFLYPFIIIVAGSLTVMINTHLAFIFKKLPFLSSFHIFSIVLLNIFPLAVVCSGFIFLYIFMPYTWVSRRSAVAGGIIAGIVYQTTQWLYISFQVGLMKLGAIYGSFAALPFFLSWLQISWIVVLVGGIIAYLYDQVNWYTKQQNWPKMSLARKKELAGTVASFVVSQYSQGKPPVDIPKIIPIAKLPRVWVQEIMSWLCACGILREVSDPSSHICEYIPHCDSADLTPELIKEKLENSELLF